MSLHLNSSPRLLCISPDTLSANHAAAASLRRLGAAEATWRGFRAQPESALVRKKGDLNESEGGSVPHWGESPFSAATLPAGRARVGLETTARLLLLLASWGGFGTDQIASRYVATFVRIFFLFHTPRQR